jgi:cation diffusion facilitator CzcD-associated flavoprotein CzcO
VATGQFVIMATGCLSSTNMPRFEGLDSFKGARYHTGEWPHEPVDFTGQRVGVIGTGSSAIQAIPIIAKQAKSLTVFQRTANYSVPARNAPLDPAYEARIKAEYAAFRARNSADAGRFRVATTRRNEVSVLSATPEERQRAFDARWQRGGLGFNGAFNDVS